MKKGWIFCFRTFGCTPQNKSIYIVGHTCLPNPMKHFSSFIGINKCVQIVFCSYVQDVSAISYVCDELKHQPAIHFLKHLGTEYFACSSDKEIANAVNLLTNEWYIESVH